MCSTVWLEELYITVCQFGNLACTFLRACINIFACYAFEPTFMVLCNHFPHACSKQYLLLTCKSPQIKPQTTFFERKSRRLLWQVETITAIIGLELWASKSEMEAHEVATVGCVWRQEISFHFLEPTAYFSIFFNQTNVTNPSLFFNQLFYLILRIVHLRAYLSHKVFCNCFSEDVTPNWSVLVTAAQLCCNCLLVTIGILTMYTIHITVYFPSTVCSHAFQYCTRTVL